MTEKAKPAFNLSAIDTSAACDKPFRLEFVHPTTKEPLGFGVMVLGKDSAAFKDHVRKRANERLRKQAQQSRRGKDADAPTIEEIEGSAIDLLVACTTAIWGEVEFDGHVFTSSPGDIRTLYTRFGQLREQADEAIGDLDNFLPA